MDVAAALHQLGSNRFRQLARSLGVPAQDLDDVRQQWFLALLEGLGQRDLVGEFASYAWVALKNEALSSRRQARRQEEFFTSIEEEPSSDERLNPEAYALARERADLLWSWIDELDAPLRIVFIESELLDRTAAEIATFHRLNENTVKTRRSLAWEKIDQVKIRWQAGQKRRRSSAVVCLAPLSYLRDFWRSFLRIAMSVLALGTIALMLGAGETSRHAVQGSTPARPPLALRFASLAAENATAAAGLHGSELTKAGERMRVQVHPFTFVAAAQDTALPVRALITPNASGGLAVLETSPENGGGAPDLLESMLIDRASAMVNLGTVEGRVMACNLLDDHVARYAGGARAPQRDALRRRARCEYNALTDTPTAER